MEGLCEQGRPQGRDGAACLGGRRRCRSRRAGPRARPGKVKQMGPILFLCFPVAVQFLCTEGQVTGVVWKLPSMRTRRCSQFFLILRNVEAQAFWNGRDSKCHPHKQDAESLPALPAASPLHTQ